VFFFCVLKEFIAFGLFEYCFVLNTKERKDFIVFFLDRLILSVYSGNPNRKRKSEEEEKKKHGRQ